MWQIPDDAEERHEEVVEPREIFRKSEEQELGEANDDHTQCERNLKNQFNEWKNKVNYNLNFMDTLALWMDEVADLLFGVMSLTFIFLWLITVRF